MSISTNLRRNIVLSGQNLKQVARKTHWLIKVCLNTGFVDKVSINLLGANRILKGERFFKFSSGQPSEGEMLRPIISITGFPLIRMEEEIIKAEIDIESNLRDAFIQRMLDLVQLIFKDVEFRFNMFWPLNPTNKRKRKNYKTKLYLLIEESYDMLGDVSIRVNDHHEHSTIDGVEYDEALSETQILAILKEKHGDVEIRLKSRYLAETHWYSAEHPIDVFENIYWILKPKNLF